MRMLNEDTDSKLDRVTVYLTNSEVKELIESLRQLLEKPSHNHHHVYSDDYRKELTICLYGVNRLSGFDERSRKLISEDI